MDNLKKWYDELKEQNFKNKNEVITYVNNNKSPFGLLVISNKDNDYVIELNSNKYICYWSKRYQVDMMLEDIIRATQILAKINVNEFYNTYTLIEFLKQL